MLLYLFITVYVYAIQARFVNTVFKTIINAFMMAVRHLPSTVLMIILNSVFFLYHVSLRFMAGILGAVRPGLPEFTPALQNI